MSIPGPWVETTATVDTEDVFQGGDVEYADAGSAVAHDETTIANSNAWNGLGLTYGPSATITGGVAQTSPVDAAWSNGAIQHWVVHLDSIIFEPFQDQSPAEVDNAFIETNPDPRRVNWIFRAGDLIEIARGVSRDMAPRLGVEVIIFSERRPIWEEDESGDLGDLTWDYYEIDPVTEVTRGDFIVTPSTAVAAASGLPFGAIRKYPNFDLYLEAVEAGTHKLSLDQIGTPDFWTHPIGDSSVTIAGCPSTLAPLDSPVLSLPDWSLRSHESNPSDAVVVYRTGLIQYYVPDGTPGYPPYTEVGKPWSAVAVPELYVALRYHPLDYRRVYTALPLAVTGLDSPADSTTTLNHSFTLTIEPPWIGVDVIAATYRVNWGDGETISSTSLTHDHSYSVAGDYSINVTATDTDGNTVTGSTMVTAIRRPATGAGTVIGVQFDAGKNRMFVQR